MTLKKNVVRHPDRGHYDRDTLDEILDSGLVCHIAFKDGDSEYNIPMTYAREGNRILIHGSVASRIYRTLASGVQCCLTVTLIDGIVLAKSAYNSSMNYRSASVYGSMRGITETDDKLKAVEAITEKMARGRWYDSRPPSDQELSATGILALDIVDFSSKVRSGPPIDNPEDRDLVYWSGVVPLETVRGNPEGSPDNLPGTKLPEYLK